MIRILNVNCLEATHLSYHISRQKQQCFLATAMVTTRDSSHITLKRNFFCFSVHGITSLTANLLVQLMAVILLKGIFHHAYNADFNKNLFWGSDSSITCKQHGDICLWEFTFTKGLIKLQEHKLQLLYSEYLSFFANTFL